VFQSKINAQHHRSNRESPLPEPYVPFTKLLRENGYSCILGNNNVRNKGRKIDVNFKHTDLGEWDGKENVGLFDKYDEFTKEDQPFFAQIQLQVTHRGDWWNEIRAQSKEPVNPDDVALPPYMADHPGVRLDWAKYLDQIEYMDSEVGTIIQDLKNKGIYDNTVIIFIGDNGRCNIRGKGYLLDPGLRIPLIMSWPKGIKPRQVRDDLVSAIDITATILDLAGVPIPDYMDGKSFLRPDFSREYVYSARDLWDEVMEKSRCVTTRQYKYIRHDLAEVPYDAHQAYLEFYRPAVHIMRKLKWEGKLDVPQMHFFRNHKPDEELYDLASDPHELNNLAENPSFRDVLEKMRAQLKEAETEATGTTPDYTPVIPEAVEVYDWVKYMHRDAYLEMLDGKEIGFQKYVKLFYER
jgi:arylsulfatase A-like enzyme